VGRKTIQELATVSILEALLWGENFCQDLAKIFSSLKPGTEKALVGSENFRSGNGKL
jgi:hypothetical protein